MKSSRDAVTIFDALDEQHPGADTELHFTNAFELLTATILSAQSTDQRVNMVTPALFKRYPDATALAKATPEELEPQIHSTGFFRAKSRALIGMATTLVEQHGGQVPADMDALTALPGVGRKTANVVLGHALGVPGLPVDRHVLRVANRIGVAEGEDAVKVEAQLCALIPAERWTRASDCLILHGRRVCKPKPLCSVCLVQEWCDYFRSGATTDARKQDAAGGRPKKTPTAASKGAAKPASASKRSTGAASVSAARPKAAAPKAPATKARSGSGVAGPAKPAAGRLVRSTQGRKPRS
ncbi:MAG: endonuclease III [Vicinamibacterales bacterium]